MFSNCGDKSVQPKGTCIFKQTVEFVSSKENVILLHSYYHLQNIANLLCNIIILIYYLYTFTYIYYLYTINYLYTYSIIYCTTPLKSAQYMLYFIKLEVSF